jgi:hypothetical protein
MNPKSNSNIDIFHVYCLVNEPLHNETATIKECGLILLLHGITPRTCTLCFCKLVPKHLSANRLRNESQSGANLNWTLNSSSISSSSQLSSQSLSPPDIASPGAAPARCARSVSVSSQSSREGVNWDNRASMSVSTTNRPQETLQTRHLPQEYRGAIGQHLEVMEFSSLLPLSCPWTT